MKHFIINVCLCAFTTLSVTAQSCPNDNHPHFIDLGLSSGTEWSCCNIGAYSPTDFGKYFGILITEKDDKHNKFDLYSLAATKAEVRELLYNCEKEWVTVKGVKGIKFIGKNGNSIFFPFAGAKDEDFYIHIGEGGYYWLDGYENLLCITNIKYERHKIEIYSKDQIPLNPYERYIKFTARSTNH